MCVSGPHDVVADNSGRFLVGCTLPIFWRLLGHAVALGRLRCVDRRMGCGKTRSAMCMAVFQAVPLICRFHPGRICCMIVSAM